MAIGTLEEYLREFSVEIGDRILTSFPALHAPGDADADRMPSRPEFADDDFGEPGEFGAGLHQ